MSILTVAAEFRRRLLERERLAFLEMANAWAQSFAQIDRELERLIARIEEAIRNGETISESWLWRRGRLEDLLLQSSQQAATYAGVAHFQVAGVKADAIRLAVESAERYIRLPRKVSNPTVTIAFNRAPAEALRSLLSTFSDGSPLRKLFQTFGPQEALAVQESLIRGIVTGKSPRQVAREVRDAAQIPYSRSLTIARTENLRSYNSASIENYRANSDAIEGWVRVERLDMRTCPVCWVEHGSIHTLGDPFMSHPNCRGTAAPIVIGVPLRVEAGSAKFARLSDKDQLAILGPSKHEAYKSGAIKLDDLVAHTDHPEWGPGIREASLPDALTRRKQAA